MSSYVIPVFPAASRVPPRDALAARLAELTGRFAELSAELAAISSAVDSVSGKADKAPPAAAGNLASLDASGNLSDSGATPESIKAAAVAEVVANAPGAMDTLKEIADILGSAPESGTVMSRISALESGKADSSSLAAVATSGSYDDLTGKPAIPSVDSSLSATSRNPVQNKVVKGALDGKVGKGGDTMTGGLTVPSLTVGSRASGSAVGARSVAEGSGNTASAIDSHAEGSDTKASVAGSHSEGYHTTARGIAAHAEGSYTTTDASYSHAEGGYTMTRNQYEHAQGMFNDSHSVAGSNFGYKGNTLSSVGFGTADGARRNAVETMQDGKTFVYGVGGYDGTNPTGSGVKDLATAVNDKADASDLPYAMVEPGKWEFSGLPSGVTVVDFEHDGSSWNLSLSDDDFGVVNEDENILSVEIVTANRVTITATRASLPGHLLDRAGNLVVVSGDTPLTLPAANAGRMRDLMVRLAVTGTQTVTFAVPSGEPQITWLGGNPPQSFGPGVHLISISESAQGEFVFIDGMLSDPESAANKVTSLSAQSTDVQYPSAKCVYDLVGDVESVLAAVNGGVAP